MWLPVIFLFLSRFIWPCACINDPHHISWPGNLTIYFCNSGGWLAGGVVGYARVFCLINLSTWWLEYTTKLDHQINGHQRAQTGKVKITHLTGSICVLLPILHIAPLQNDKCTHFSLFSYHFGRIHHFVRRTNLVDEWTFESAAKCIECYGLSRNQLGVLFNQHRNHFCWTNDFDPENHKRKKLSRWFELAFAAGQQPTKRNTKLIFVLCDLAA